MAFHASDPYVADFAAARLIGDGAILARSAWMPTCGAPSRSLERLRAELLRLHILPRAAESPDFQGSRPR
jgi:hypothetical protein